MQKPDVEDTFERNGFVFTDLESGARVSVSGLEVPVPVGQKTFVRVVRRGETLHKSKHSSSAAAASKYVELVE